MFTEAAILLHMNVQSKAFQASFKTVDLTFGMKRGKSSISPVFVSPTLPSHPTLQYPRGLERLSKNIMTTGLAVQFLISYADDLVKLRAKLLQCRDRLNQGKFRLLKRLGMRITPSA